MKVVQCKVDVQAEETSANISFTCMSELMRNTETGQNYGTSLILISGWRRGTNESDC